MKAILIAGAILASSGYGYWQGRPGMNEIAPADKLIDKFELTVFRTDDEPPGFAPDAAINKWNKKLHVRINGEEAKRFQADVQRTLDTLSRLSGLHMDIVDRDDGSGSMVEFHMPPPERVAEIVLSQDKDYNNQYPKGKKVIFYCGIPTCGHCS